MSKHPHPKQLYLDGQAAKDKEYEEAEKKKIGLWRGGNAGAVVDGFPTGSCPRLMYLRTKKGWQPPHDKSDIQSDGVDRNEVMWGKGRFNEDFHMEKMAAALPSDYVLLREEEIPVSWTMQDEAGGGRPDIVLCEKASAEDLLMKPVHLLEHKSICGSGMAVKVFKNQPKLAHILQGANYAYHLGQIPCSLVYTSSDYRKVSWAEQADCPPPGHVHSEHIKYDYQEAYLTAHKASKKGWTARSIAFEKWKTLEHQSFRDKNNKLIPKAQATVKYIKPFMVWYDVAWIGGTVRWKLDSQEWWTDTGITIEDIYSLYMMAAEMGDTNRLPPRPVALMADMKSDKWSACGLCPLEEVCSYTERQRIEETDRWEELVEHYFAGEMT